MTELPLYAGNNLPVKECETRTHGRRVASSCDLIFRLDCIRKSRDSGHRPGESYHGSCRGGV